LHKLSADPQTNVRQYGELRASVRKEEYEEWAEKFRQMVLAEAVSDNARANTRVLADSSGPISESSLLSQQRNTVSTSNPVIVKLLKKTQRYVKVTISVLWNLSSSNISKHTTFLGRIRGFARARIVFRLSRRFSMISTLLTLPITVYLGSR
jgi:hypothetical protein